MDIGYGLEWIGSQSRLCFLAESFVSRMNLDTRCLSSSLLPLTLLVVTITSYVHVTEKLLYARKTGLPASPLGIEAASPVVL